MGSDDSVARLAQAAKIASSRIVRVAAATTPTSARDAQVSSFEEVQETILALIAATIAADGATTRQEFLFASLIAKDLSDPLRCRAYLTEYAQKWIVIAGKTPRFLEQVVEYDRIHRTTHCKEILAELEGLVRCVALVDRESIPAEAEVANGLIAHVEALFRQARWSVQWEESPHPFTPPPTAMNRNEFHGRDIL